MNVKELIRTINHTLKSHNLFPENSRILVACSGGPDSMALLHLLKDIAIHRHTTYEIGVAIVDHCIRPESKEEVLWLQHQVEALGLPFYSATFDVPRLSKEQKMSEETMGRQVRYQWLTEVAKSENYDYIAVAHHKDDQAESILAHIIRGSGLNGLAGMSVVALNMLLL
ncbi:tRNA lysidine(34) synthetase TilS [Veillonella sp. AM51-8BH]|uniref:tRNA lysidine(34) synthetase TilS n=1 Tax=Veillonella sp. AM51-8BH TaxID=2292378 RepID=UPI002100B85F|nr:tRNA lysidine(34) synthetase TilS [Veillonella sp. AM51-8BH]